MVKNLTVLLALSVLLTACGGSDNNNSSKSSSSVAMSSSSVAVSSSSVAVSSSSVAVSSSSVAMSSSSVAMSSSSVAMSSSSEVVVESSSSVAASSSSVASSSSSSASGVVCEPNPDSVIALCDLTNWVVDGGNGGTITQGPSGPIFHNAIQTGTADYNVPGMFYKYDLDNQTVTGKTLTMVVVMDEELKASGGYFQVFIQQNGGSYGGKYCDFQYADVPAGQETTLICEFTGTNIANGVPSIRLGFQLKNATAYNGTLEVVDAYWE